LCADQPIDIHTDQNPIGVGARTADGGRDRVDHSFLGEEWFVVEFPAENVAVSVPYTHVGDDLYWLDGIPFGVDSAGFGDVIEAEPVGEGRLRFRCVAERSG
jgi:hypothetical protein